MQDKIVKQYDALDLQLDEGSRTVVSVINTDAIDRDGEVVQPKGLKRKNYSGNPVVMVNHDYTSLPVGKSLWIKASTHGDRDVLIAKTYISDKTELARDTFGLLQDKVLNAFSIGFQPVRASAPSTKEVNLRPELARAKMIFREWELLEYSVVGVPCNPEAVALAVSKGYSKSTIDIISGANANGAKATAEVVAAVAEHFAPQKSTPTEKDIRKQLAKKLEEYTAQFDRDRVVSAALNRLKGLI